MISHKNLRTISIWLGAFLAIVIIVAGLSVFVAKKYINPELIKGKILSTLSEKVGGDAEFEDIRVEFFYLPHVVLTGGHVSVPDKLEASFESLTVYPKLLPLLKGKVKLSYVQISKPVVKVFLTENEAKERTSEPVTIAGIKADVLKVLEFLDTREKDSKAEIKNGDVRILKNNEDFLNFSELNSVIVYPDDRLNYYISASSNISKQIILDGWINTDNYDGKGTLRLKAFYPHKLINIAKPGEDLFKDSEVDLSLGFDVKELNIFNLNLKIPSHKISIAKGGEELEISGRNLDADIYIDEERSDISLNNAESIHPALKTSGKFKIDKKKNAMSLSIAGKDIEVESSRKGALLVAGDNHIVDVIFKIVRGGKVPDVTLEAKGGTIKDLLRRGNYVVKGNMVDGKLFIPGVDFDLYDVQGDAVIADGALKGTNLSAKRGSSSGYGGSLIVGVEGPIGPLKLDITVDGNLAELPPLLKRFVHDEGFQEELALITNVEGRTTGKLVLGDMKKSPKVSFYASEFNIAADYGRVPYPVKAVGGEFNHHKKHIDIQDVNISLGNSFLNGVSGTFEWEDIRILEVKSSDTSLKLSEFYPWLQSFDEIKEHLEHIEAMKGTMYLSPFSFSGPLLTHEEWKIESLGKITDMSVKLRGLDNTVNIPETNFEVTQDEISVSDTSLTAGETSLSAGFKMWGYLSGALGMHISFSGNMDAATSNIVSDMVKLPQQIGILGDISISDSSVILESGNTAAAAKETVGERASTKQYKLDINVDADSFEWSDTEVSEKEQEPRPEEGDKKGTPIYGNVVFNSDEFKYKGFNWDSINGDIGFTGHNVNINIKDASLCGISTPGYFEVSPPGLKLDFAPNSQGEALGETIDCLFEKAGIITGEYDFEGNVYSKGSNGSVVESLEGELKLSSSDGRVEKYGGFAKLLTVLNFGEIFRGNGTDFGKDGFPYNFLMANAQIIDGKLHITEAAMDGPSLKVVCTGYIDLTDNTLDLEILVIPVLAVDSVIDKIPLLSSIIGQKTSSIPIRITGTLSDPEYSKTSPHAIKSGLLTILKETLNIPITIIKPVKSDMKKEKEEERQEKENAQSGEQD